MIRPKLGSARDVPGCANCGVLKRLIDSARRVTALSPPKGRRRDSAALIFRIPSLRNVLRPKFPAGSCGRMNSNAERDSAAVEVSGLSTVPPIRRHLGRAYRRRGFRWKQWSKECLYETLGLSMRIPTLPG